MVYMVYAHFKKKGNRLWYTGWHAFDSFGVLYLILVVAARLILYLFVVVGLAVILFSCKLHFRVMLQGNVGM